MKLPLEITFRNMKPSEAIDADIREKAAKLDRFSDDVMACRVAVEAPHKHHHKGNIYHVRIEITVPDGKLVVSRDPKDNQAHEDAYVAIRDAFDAARRQLQDFVRRRRQAVKSHEPPLHGRIVELVPEENYGRIETSDGRTLYFHRNSVLNTEFDKLTLDAEVRLEEESGDRGPQASTVKVVGKHHVVG